MAYQEEAVQTLRYLIGDFDSDDYTYCDERLFDLFLGSAKLVISEVIFDTTYTITLTSSSISPDPENMLIVLACLKAACIIANSEYKAAANNSITVVDGPSTINLGGQGPPMKERAKTLCQDYQNAKKQYALGSGTGIRFVLSPTTSPNPQYPTYRENNY